MGFFKDFKNDLSQAVDELTEDSLLLSADAKESVSSDPDMSNIPADLSSEVAELLTGTFSDTNVSDLNYNYNSDDDIMVDTLNEDLNEELNEVLNIDLNMELNKDLNEDSVEKIKLSKDIFNDSDITLDDAIKAIEEMEEMEKIEETEETEKTEEIERIEKTENFDNKSGDIDRDIDEDMDIEALLRSLDGDTDTDTNNVDSITTDTAVSDSDTFNFEDNMLENNASSDLSPVIPDVPVEEQSAYQEISLGEATDEVTVIAKGLKIQGNLSSAGSIELNGELDGTVICNGKLSVGGSINGDINAGEFYSVEAHVQGDIHCNGMVKIGNGSIVHGNIFATAAVIAGAVKGDIDVKGPVILDSKAVILGNIKSENIQINRGALLKGNISQCYSDRNPEDYFG